MVGLSVRAQHTETKIKVERIGRGDSAVKTQPNDKDEANRLANGTKVRNFS